MNKGFGVVYHRNRRQIVQTESYFFCRDEAWLMPCENADRRGSIEDQLPEANKFQRTLAADCGASTVLIYHECDGKPTVCHAKWSAHKTARQIQ